MIADQIAAGRTAIAAGAVVLVPTDTVYGLAAHLDDPAAVAALYALKGRDRSQSCQVLLFGASAREDALAPLPSQTADLVRALLPGTTTCIVPDPSGRFAAAAGATPGTVGLRIPAMPPAFAALDLPLIATSANLPGGPDPRAVADVPESLRAGLGAVIDAGTLGGVASAVVDLRTPSVARVLRPGPDPSGLTDLLVAHGWSIGA